MSFVDFIFYPAAAGLVFFLILAQFILRGKERISNQVTKLVLLAFSYAAMGMYDWRFCICMTAVILVTWGSALEIGRTSGRERSLWTGCSVALLILFLGIFKYLNFFMESLYGIAGREWSAASILLPLGISFYIFSAIGYLLDVSWGNAAVERSFVDVALFLAFFPKMVCGPIVRGRDFLPQLKENRRITCGTVKKGIQIFMFGLFKKIVLADHLAVFVDDVYAAPAAFGTFTVWLAVFSYFIQLYFDFSGYSDMAVGMSKILGYDIQKNFNFPFAAENISEFWNRWHISLSSWLNEYLFNPLALKWKRNLSSLPRERRKKLKMFPDYAALLVTFLISGLWHGAGWTFIFWGFLHGAYSVLHAMYRNWRKHHVGAAEKLGLKQCGGVASGIRILLNIFAIHFIQIFFRADTVGQAFYILKRMFTLHAGIEQPYAWTFFSYAMLALAALAAWIHKKKEGTKQIEGFYPVMDLSTVCGLTVFFIFSGLTVMLAYFGETYFIYGRF